MLNGFQRKINHTQGSLLGNGLDHTKYNMCCQITLLLVKIEKFEANPMLVNVNKLKPYKYMESEFQKQEQQMPIYLEHNSGGF